VENLFDGGMLVLAVGLAGYAARRRLRAAAAARNLTSASPATPSPAVESAMPDTAPQQ
jgi:ribose transport system permease protein